MISILAEQSWQFLGRLLLNTDRFWLLESFYSGVVNTVLLDEAIRSFKCCFSVAVSVFVYIEFTKCFENVVRKLMNAIEIFCSLGIFTNNLLF